MGWIEEDDLIYYIPKKAFAKEAKKETEEKEEEREKEKELEKEDKKEKEKEEEKTPKRCAFFDLDGTLAVAVNQRGRAGKSNSLLRRTPADNWVLFPGVLEKLQSLTRENVTLAIFSNQSDFTEAMFPWFKSIAAHFEENNVTIYWFLAVGKKSQYRKPDVKVLKRFGKISKINQIVTDESVTTWNFSKAELRKKYGVECFYCGDAVGEDDEYPPYQWGDTDKIFAENAGMEFKRPITYFGSGEYKLSEAQEIIILCGMQGTGKTTLARKVVKENQKVRKKEGKAGKEYVHGSRDELKKKLERFVAEALNEGKSVIIDATHYNEAARAGWVELAAERKNISLVWWLVKDGRIFNDLRKENGEKGVPSIAIDKHCKNFVRPDPEKEGFTNLTILM